MKNEFMSFKEAVAFLGISNSTLYKLTSLKEIKFYKPKGKIFFKKDDLISYITEGGNTDGKLSSNLINGKTNGK